MKTKWPENTVALTGTIGSGKSTVSSMLKAFGAFTEDADRLARDAVAVDSPGLLEVVRVFGRTILAENGTLNRQKLGELVFNDQEKRKALEDIVHPIVNQLAEQSFAKAMEKDYLLFVYECPLLFESGLDQAGFQKIVVVIADDKNCIERIVQRDKISREEASRRVAAQFPVAKKKEKADYLIDNSSTVERLEEQVRRLFEELTAKSEGSR